MAKLTKTLDNLQGKGIKDRSRNAEDLGTAVKFNTDTLATRIDQALSALNNASNQSLNKLGTALVAEFKKLVPIILEAHNEQVQRIDALETRLAKSEQLSRDNTKVLLGGIEKSVLDQLRSDGKKTRTSIDAIGSDVGNISFPEQIPTDLTGLTDLSMSVLETVGNIKPVVIPKRASEWDFHVVHFIPDDPNSGIRKVRVRVVN